MPNAWEFVFALPNLRLPNWIRVEKAGDEAGIWPDGLTLGSPHLAIVPPDDPRVRAILVRNPAVGKLLSAFVDTSGNPFAPAVLIASESAPTHFLNTLDPIVAFRNAVTLSFLLRARAELAAGGYGHESPIWSESFDLHPTTVTRGGRILTETAALRAIYAADTRLVVSHSPHVFHVGRRLIPDHFIYRTLGAEFKRRFRHGQTNDPARRALFRSLEMAFRAASLGTYNLGTLSDYGTQVALWVSAMEILAWRDGKGANQTAVQALLGSYPWSSRLLQARRYSIGRSRQSRRGNAVQRVCHLMYRARNAFIHGDPVTWRSLHKRSQDKNVGLPRLAAVVYAIALRARLAEWHRLKPETLADLEGNAFDITDEWSYSGALRDAFGLKLKRRTH